MAPIVAEAAPGAAMLVGADVAVLSLWRGSRDAFPRIVSRFGETDALLELLRSLNLPAIAAPGKRLVRIGSVGAGSISGSVKNGIRAALVVPFPSREGPLGLLAVARKRAVPFSPGEENQLLEMADSLRPTLLLWKRAETDALKGARRPGRLTPRERQIVELLASDKTCKEVAAELELSARTVEHHVERLKTRHRHSTIHGLISYLAKLGV